MTNRNVIFDLDGTLIDSSLGIMESFSKAFSVCNINLVRSLDSIVIGPPLMETLSLLSGTSDIIVLQRLSEAFKEHYDTYGYKKTIVFYGVNKMLSSLKKSNLKMYIATNKRILPTMKIVNLFKWNNIFDGIFALDSFLPVARSKQEILLKIVEKYNIEPDDALYIGDMKSDMIAAKESNIEYVMVTWGNGQNFNFECDSVDSPLNLRDIIIQDT